MCKFCEELKKRRRCNISRRENDCGVLGKFCTSIIVWDIRDGTFALETLSTGVLTGVEEASVKINYCPICGRKLVEE